MWLFSAVAFKSSEQFSIEKTTQALCFRNCQKTSTWPLSTAASSVVKSHFLAICTLQKLLSNCRFPSRWPLQAAAFRVILPSLPVISTLTPWFSNYKEIDVVIKGCCFETCRNIIFCAMH
jgi:hypothetical protein